MDKNKIIRLQKRCEEIHKETKHTGAFVAFPEIKLTDQQIGEISLILWGLEKEEAQEYLREKLQGQVFFSNGEDQQEFQYIFDLGVKALKNGFKIETIDKVIPPPPSPPPIRRLREGDEPPKPSKNWKIDW